MNESPTDAIRRTLASGDFAAAYRLWMEYADELQAAVEAGKASEAQLAEVADLVQWAKLTVESFRAHALAQIYQARAAQVYARNQDAIT